MSTKKRKKKSAPRRKRVAARKVRRLMKKPQRRVRKQARGSAPRTRSRTRSASRAVVAQAPAVRRPLGAAGPAVDGIYSVYLTRDVAEAAMQLGNGDLSTGITNSIVRYAAERLALNVGRRR